MPSKTNKFEKLFEAVPDALVGMDQKGVIRFVNRQTESLFGYDRDDLVGEPVEIIVPEPLWQIYAQNRDQYFADPITRSSGLEVELIGRRQDRSEFPVNITIAHIDTGDVLLVITAVADVARREAAVRKARLIAAVVEYSNDAVISGTLEGIVTSWNPAAERMYGYSSKEMIGRSAAILTPEDRAPEFVANMASVRDDQPVRNFETVRLRKDGSLLPVSLTAAPIHDENGVIVGTSVVHRDVTERRRALELAQRIAAIVESSGDAIIGATLDGVVTSWNPAAEKMFGYSGHAIIGKPLSMLSPQDQTAQQRAVLIKIKATGVAQQVETTRIRADGTVFPASLTVSPIRDQDGTVVGISGTVRDVTEQNRSMETAQRMEVIVRNSWDAIVGRDLNGVITSWNPAAERMYGYSRDEVIGMSARFLTPQDRAHEADEIIARLAAGQPVEELETLRVRKDGTTIPVSITVSPIFAENGEIIGASTISRDLSQVKEAASYARSLIEAALDPMLTIGAEGAIDDVNEAVVRLTGVPREDLIGSDITAYVTEPDKAMAGYRQTFEQGSVTDYPLTVHHRDGTLTDLLFNASVYRDVSGNVLGVLAAGRDVTERRRAFEAAQSLAAIIESSDDAIVSGSMDGLVTSWNPAAERMYGYSRAEIIGKPAKILVPHDRESEISEVLEQIRAGRHLKHRESERVRKDGSVFPVLLTVSPIRNADGTIVGTSVIHRDLTEQKGALAAAERFTAIVENSSDAIMSRTLDGTITSWNPAAERMFGYSSEEIVGMSINLLSPEERSGELLSTLASISAGKAVTDFETTCVRKDGRPLTVSLTTSPIRNHKGAVVGASVIYRDVTELKHAARYARSLIEAALDPLVTISPEGRIDDVNEATVQVTGVPRNKLIGTDFSAYFTDPDKAHEGYRRAFDEGSVTDYPLTLVHRDGSRTDVTYNASVFRDTSGKVLGLIAAARKVTERK